MQYEDAKYIFIKLTEQIYLRKLSK